MGYNNNYAPVTLGPDGAAYVGVLGGLVRDKAPPAQTAPTTPRLKGDRTAAFDPGAAARDPALPG